MLLVRNVSHILTHCIPSHNLSFFVLTFTHTIFLFYLTGLPCAYYTCFVLGIGVCGLILGISLGTLVQSAVLTILITYHVDYVFSVVIKTDSTDSGSSSSDDKNSTIKNAILNHSTAALDNHDEEEPTIIDHDYGGLEMTYSKLAHADDASTVTDDDTVTISL